MDNLMTAAAGGMRARMESLDLLANNVANSSTVAFKADREFYGVYLSEEANAAADRNDPTLTPVIEKHWTDYSQGTFLPSSSPLDLAIKGRGFFIAETATGPLYTRNGNFRLSEGGEIETQEGYAVRVKTIDGKPLHLDVTRAVDVGVDGTIRQDGQDLGRIETVDFDNGSAVAKRGSTYFEWRDTGNPKTAANAEIHQGVVESSNVPVAEAAVRLVSVMRQFEMLQKAMTLGSEMNRRSVEEVAKVS